MEKTLFRIDENSGERFYLYTGINALYGEWMLETGGNPDTLNTLEDEGCDELIAEINAAISSPSTAWEPLTDGDKEYIAEYLDVWGITE